MAPVSTAGPSGVRGDPGEIMLLHDKTPDRHVSKPYGYVRVRTLLAFMVSVAVRESVCGGTVRLPGPGPLEGKSEDVPLKPPRIAGGLHTQRAGSSYGYGYPYGAKAPVR